MNRPSRAFIVFAIVGMLISSCAPGQIFGPTITPSPTITPTTTFTPTLVPTATPTITPTSTPEPVKWDISPSYTEIISGTVMGVLPIQVSLETDVTRGGLKYGIRTGWKNRSGQTGEESLAELWARAIFEAWWYNTEHSGEPTEEDFIGYVQKWSECLNADPSGQDKCWSSIHFEIIANDMRTSTYDPVRILVNPPAQGRIIFVGDHKRVKNITRGIGTCLNGYGTNFLDGILTIYVGKAEGCQCRSRAATVTVNMVRALKRLRVSSASTTGNIFPPSSLFSYASQYAFDKGPNSDRVFILKEKFSNTAC